ncbi:ubiquitin-protein ligase E3C-like, partial [Diaphorina citri]|uniref:HECT-type E3 ubiquitin transferase n=1 Tax=Diaphorina citri TaxID=121845 RepID=A0A3Q0JHQ6_DIACI
PELRHVMRVQLINAVGLDEAGIDGGGLFREFLSELLKTAFDPKLGFFKLTEDNLLYPNPSVGLIYSDSLKHYYFIGRMLGKALYENLLVELPLADLFLSKLVSRHSDVDIHHLATLDAMLYRNLLYLKHYEDVSSLGLDFTVLCDELGERRVSDIICVIYGSAKEYILQKLNPVHHAGIRIATGALRSSPVPSLYVESGIMPLSLRRSKMIMNYVSKIGSCHTNPIHNEFFNRNYDFANHPNTLDRYEELDLARTRQVYF